MFKPQAGFQEKALSTPADVAIIGGSAGGGKTFVKLMESTRHTNNPNFGFIAFRRTTTQIRAQGGLWDTSKKIYMPIGAVPKDSVLEWTFPSGARGKFAHLEHEKDADNYQGSQIPLIIFDELTHFTEYQFWTILSRNRSDCGVRPYVRASCNPLPGSFVAKLIEWYIDQATGFPIPERSGVIRYFTRDGDVIVWGDTKQEVIDQCPHIFQQQALIDSGTDMEDLIRSFTFIAGSIYENKIFIKQDPQYLGVLLSLPKEEKLRLLEGNWLISLDGLMIPEWNKIERLFDNFPEQSLVPKKCITVDAARFGRDYCVIMVWKGWEVVFMIIIEVSDTFDIVQQIEFCRRKFSVQKDNVVVDQDGVGNDTVKIGGYEGFHGGHSPVKDPETRILENYKNYKTQCYYRFCLLRINTGQIRFSIENTTCLIFTKGSTNGVYTTKIKVRGKLVDVRDLIKEDFRTIKRAETINEGVDKIQMISKDEQKNLLGRSPDFSDCAMMREHIEMIPIRKKMMLKN